MVRGGSGCALSIQMTVFRLNFQHYRKIKTRSVKSTLFYPRNLDPRRTTPKTATLSRIRTSRALGPAIWGTRPPAAPRNTILSDRPLLLSRARGGVCFRSAQPYRGSDVPDGGRDGNLRQIRRGRFSILQHSRGSDVPDRGRAGDLRCIRRRRP